MDTHHTEKKRPHKIAIIGLGNIGTEVDRLLRQRGAADHIEGWNRSEPKEIEKFEGRQIAYDQTNIINAGTNGQEGETPHFKYRFGIESLDATLRDSNIVIVTAGVPRTDPKQDRTALQAKNQEVIQHIAEIAAKAAPNATYIIATNPVDTMTQLFQEKSGIHPDRIIGLSGELDRARLVQAIAFKLQVHHKRIKNARVYGQHGANMVIPFGEIVIVDEHGKNPQKLTDILSKEELDVLRMETVKGGEKLVGMLGTSDHEAPAAALNKMAFAVSNGMEVVGSAYDAKDGVYIGRPVQFRSDGGYETLPLPFPVTNLDPERVLWNQSLKACDDAMKRVPGRNKQIAA